MFGQNDSRTEACPIGMVIALPDSVEAIAGSNNPGIGRWAFQVLAVILEYCRISWRNCRKVVEGLIYAGRQARGRDIVSKNSAIYDLREEGGAREHFPHHVWDIFLPFRSKGFLIA